MEDSDKINTFRKRMRTDEERNLKGVKELIEQRGFWERSKRKVMYTYLYT